MAATKRTFRYKNETLTVRRIYSSGVGTTYAVIRVDAATGKEKVEPLTDEMAAKNPETAALLDACREAFEDRMTMDKIPPGVS